MQWDAVLHVDICAKEVGDSQALVFPVFFKSATLAAHSPLGLVAVGAQPPSLFSAAPRRPLTNFALLRKRQCTSSGKAGRSIFGLVVVGDEVVLLVLGRLGVVALVRRNLAGVALLILRGLVLVRLLLLGAHRLPPLAQHLADLAKADARSACIVVAAAAVRRAERKVLVVLLRLDLCLGIPHAWVDVVVDLQAALRATGALRCRVQVLDAQLLRVDEVEERLPFGARDVAELVLGVILHAHDQVKRAGRHDAAALARKFNSVDLLKWQQHRRLVHVEERTVERVQVAVVRLVCAADGWLVGGVAERARTRDLGARQPPQRARKHVVQRPGQLGLELVVALFVLCGELLGGDVQLDVLLQDTVEQQRCGGDDSGAAAAVNSSGEAEAAVKQGRSGTGRIPSFGPSALSRQSSNALPVKIPAPTLLMLYPQTPGDLLRRPGAKAARHSRRPAKAARGKGGRPDTPDDLLRRRITILCPAPREQACSCPLKTRSVQCREQAPSRTLNTGLVQRRQRAVPCLQGIPRHAHRRASSHHTIITGELAQHMRVVRLALADGRVHGHHDKRVRRVGLWQDEEPLHRAVADLEVLRLADQVERRQMHLNLKAAARVEDGNVGEGAHRVVGGRGAGVGVLQNLWLKFRV
eukprot:364861-Chlamydomonas_euryale.AAC.5